MLLPINNIIITNRQRHDLGDITNLAASMKKFGLLAPVVINESNHLIAGERRIRAAELLGWNEIDVTITSTANAEDTLLMEISENIDRKSFTREEQVNAGIELERIESIRAEERQRSTLKQNSTEVQNFAQRSECGKTRDKVASYLGMSHTQYERDKFIVANKELFPVVDKDGEDVYYDDWNNFKVSTNKAYIIIRNLLNQQTPKPNPKHTAKSATKSITPSSPPSSVVESVVEKIVEVVPDDYETIKTEIINLRTDIATKNQRITELESMNVDDDIQHLKDQNQKLTATIAEREQRIEQLESDISTFNNAAFLERNSTNVYRALDGTDDIYELGYKIRKMLEEDLAPLKFRRCFERIPVSATARENLQTMLDSIRSWCFEMDGLLNDSTNPNKATMVIDY